MKRNLLFLLYLFYCFWGILLDATEQELLRRAQIYTEAKMYDKALGTYKELLEGDIKDRQRSIIAYDIGNVYAEQRDWAQAIRQYTSIPLGEGASPLIAQRVYTNLGLAHYALAIELNQENLGKGNDIKIVYHLKQAGIAFALAAKNECILQELGGIAPCQTSKEIQKWQIATNNGLKEAQDKLAKAGGKPSEKSKPEKAGLEGWLEKIIELQEQVLNEAHLSQKPNKEEQQKVLTLVDQFLPMVIKEQNEKFSKEGTCQSSPWGEAIPSFVKGKESVLQAYSYLEKGENLPQAIVLQEEALETWKQTLEAMKNPQTPKGSCFASRTQGKSEEKQEETKEQPASTEEVLRFLQQMNLNDAVTPQNIPAVKQVNKPW